MDLQVPAGALVGELAATVLAPTAVGVAVRTSRPARIAPVEPALSTTASLAYLALVLAVVGPNAAVILDAPLTVAGVAAVTLNGFGYLVGAATRPLVPDPGDRAAMLFTVSKKEFSIAAFVVFASGLPPEVALPAVVYAVVQMVTSPLVAGRLARSA